MAVNSAAREPAGIAEQHLALLSSEGLASHPHLAALVEGRSADLSRDLSDAVHLLCSLYGSHPGLVEIALSGCPHGSGREWMAEASESFERERLYLVRLTSAIGPLPSTPGAAATATTLVAQRHALETLARSERRGTAIGASSALVHDWRLLRALLDRGANRVGMDIPASLLPDSGSVGRAVADIASGNSIERALRFGSEQLLLQNRGLFDLLEARAAARRLA